MRWILPLAVTLAACEPAVTARAPVASSTENDAEIFRIEDETIRDLAALDRRFAKRARIEPTDADLHRVTMDAMLAEDPSLAVVNGAIDPFSFEARARGLAVVQTKVQSAPRGAPGARVAGERELLVRLADEELVRLAEDRALPRSASSLVRGVIATWQTPRTREESAERDRWLARRLEEVLKALSAGLDVGRARELDDTLDALEHLMDASALAKSTAALVRLRDALEQLGNQPRAAAASDWEWASRSLKAHLGLTLSADEWDEKLAALEQQLETQTNAAIEAAKVPSDGVETTAASLVFSAQSCAAKIEDSRLRVVEPGPERSAAATVACLAAGTTDDLSRAVALMVAHDQVTVARWALDVVSGKLTIAESTAKHRPRSRPKPDFTARWERVALSQPTRALGGGYAAVLVYGAPDPASRARRWATLGDVPLDIAERELR